MFTTPDPKSFTGGTVKGTIKNVKQDTQDGIFQQGDLATATATVLPLDAEDPPVGGDEPISMAERLKDNTYSIQKKGGEVQVFTLPQEYSSWYVGTSYMDGTKGLALRGDSPGSSQQTHHHQPGVLHQVPLGRCENGDDEAGAE